MQETSWEDTHTQAVDGGEQRRGGLWVYTHFHVAYTLMVSKYCCQNVYILRHLDLEKESEFHHGTLT